MKIKEFKFFSGEKRRRNYYHVDPGVPNVMSLPVGVLYYTQETIGGLLLLSHTIATNQIIVNSFRNFLYENRENYIWIHQWGVINMDGTPTTMNNFTTIDEIPMDERLHLRCVIRRD